MKTYVVRVAGPVAQDPEGFAALRGVVDEVATGRRTAFHDADELLSLLAGELPDDAEPGTETELTTR